MSVKKDTKRGTWYFIVDVPGPNGRRQQHRRRGFKTKKTAAAAQTELLASIRRGEYVSPSKATVATYLESTWLPAVARKVRPTTADGYRRAVAKHIAPHIGGVELQLLDEARVACWLGELTDAGLSPKSVRNVHGVLSAALEYARMPLRLVNRNVARGAELPALPQRKSRAWTAEQIGRFLAHVESDRWAPLWRLIATTGMRRGEALGLRWSDVDLERGVITITNQRTIAGGRMVEGVPKSDAGRRSVTVDAGTLAALRGWRRQQAHERLLVGAGWRGGSTCSRGRTDRSRGRSGSPRGSRRTRTRSVSRTSVYTVCGTRRRRG
jgi:integrase